MSRITPASIAAEWASVVVGLDPLFFQAEARRFIVDPEIEAVAIGTAVAHEAVLRPTEPDFFATLDYDWAFDPASWDRGIDAVFQMRVLQMLSTLRSQPKAATNLDFGRIVVRRVDSVTAFDCSPRLVRASSLRFVVMPFVFSELAGLLLRGFAEWIGGDARADWDGLIALFADEARECPPSVRQAIARIFTDPVFDLFSPVEQPAWTLRREAPWFASASEIHETGENNLAEAHLSYALHDFALAHELGHALLGHARVEPGDDRLTRELAADELAMRLYAGSWGWRDDLLDGAPLDQAARNLLGPIMFVWFCEWQMTLVFACTARLRDRMTDAERAEFRSRVRRGTPSSNAARTSCWRWRSTIPLPSSQAAAFFHSMMPPRSAICRRTWVGSPSGSGNGFSKSPQARSRWPMPCVMMAAQVGCMGEETRTAGLRCRYRAAASTGHFNPRDQWVTLVPGGLIRACTTVHRPPIRSTAG